MNNHFGGLINLFKTWFCFHKWEDIKTGERKETFLGETIIRDEHGFRGCRKCGVVQEYHYDSQGGCWSALDNKQMEILKQKNLW